MSDVLDDLRNVQKLRGDTYSSAEVLGMVGRAADEIERLTAALRWYAGHLRPEDRLADNGERASAALEGK